MQYKLHRHLIVDAHVNRPQTRMKLNYDMIQLYQSPIGEILFVAIIAQQQ